jgi:4-methyl-5(b-hydroxyethyl)-thiazole monophosphate biosynthesis
MVRKQNDESRLLAAICAAPVVFLHHHGLLKGRKFTCHPDFVHLLGGIEIADSPVVVDGNLATSRGAGTAVMFAMKLVELLYDKQRVKEVAAGMVLPLSQMMYI